MRSCVEAGIIIAACGSCNFLVHVRNVPVSAKCNATTLLKHGSRGSPTPLTAYEGFCKKILAIFLPNPERIDAPSGGARRVDRREIQGGTSSPTGRPSTDYKMRFS
jgi:hypothetical protein